MQTFTDHQARSGATRLHLSGEQLARLRAEVQGTLEDHRRHLQENEELFGVLVSDPSVDAGERQAARVAAAKATEVCEEAERALAAMDDGAYGRCTGCGQDIPFERLEALPLTQSCVACPQP
ncbi:MAG TPA: TraR/DksA C4-type zinc finger protein [Acidimicrobiales bacterium]|nr:TraR/DksA C4-type zinc finger protein [Acidimicrobiales bacterium]